MLFICCSGYISSDTGVPKEPPYHEYACRRLAPGRKWGLLNIMKSFNPSLLTHAFKQLTFYEQQVSHENAPNTEVSQQFKADVQLTLTTARIIATALNLAETQDAAKRLDLELRSTAEPLTCSRLQHVLHDLLELMESELEKRKVFAIDADKTRYYQDDIYGVNPPLPTPLKGNALLGVMKPTDPLLTERAALAFPSAYMDMVEAGRCLALNRNNAAVYHLMQVAEVGLRTLAWDRRVVVKRGKAQNEVPLEFAQWGEMIGQIQKKKELIHKWPRSKVLRDEAYRYYARALFEVDSFNEIFRKHISHARGEVYASDVAISCWSHVYRFMDMLAERMTEEFRTNNVWVAKKKPSAESPA
jgi:hypothetical protein